MDHTREHLRRQRGLYVMIIVLVIIWMIEPSMSAMTDMCRGLFERFYGGAR